MIRLASSIASVSFICTVHAAVGNPGCPPFPQAKPETQQRRTAACNENFEALERSLTAVQRDYEAGKVGENEVFRSYTAFNIPFEVPGFFERWIAKYPGSYPAHVAAARHEVYLGHRARGTELAKDTSREQFAQMSEHFTRAKRLLERSLTLSARPTPSYTYLLQISRHYTSSCREHGFVAAIWYLIVGGPVTPDPCARKLVDRALALDPAARDIRNEYMYSLEPRWGGNIVAMQAFYAESEKSPLDRSALGCLRAPILSLQAKAEERIPDKLRLATEANKLCESVERLRYIIYAQHALRLWGELVPVANRALELEPGQTWTLVRRGVALWQLGRTQEAFPDFLAAAEKGDAFSQNKVGFFYLMGQGVPKNLPAAIQWFQKGAAGGDKDAINNLAKLKTGGHVK